MRLFTAIFILLFLVPLLASADTLWLRDGTKIEGTIQNETSDNVTFKTPMFTLTISRARIQKIEGAKGEAVEKIAPTPSGKNTFEQAEELYHDGKFREAVPLYEKALQEDKKNIDAARRLEEIRRKNLSRMITSGEENVGPITEQEMIFSMSGKGTPLSIIPSQPQSPFPSPTPGIPSPFATPMGIGKPPLLEIPEAPSGQPPIQSPFIVTPTPAPPVQVPQQGIVQSPFITNLPAPTTIPTLVSANATQPQVVNLTEPSEEFRAAIITRFEWANYDSVVCKQNILRALDNLTVNNFNAIFFQIRGQGDVLYPSPYEPWSPIIGGKDPGFDPLQFAIEEAHARGLELYACISPYTVWQGTNTPPHSTPEHPFYLYCQPDSNPNWACYDNAGQIQKPDVTENDNYYYFSPGIPDVNAYVRKIVMDVVKRYDVDGINFDRVGYPGPQYSHDAVSKSRFAGEGNPGNLSWEDWQRDQITRFLNDIYGEIASLKPKVKITCAVWGIYDRTRYSGYEKFPSGFQDYYQDSFAYLKKGVVDAICPMISWDIKDPKPNYDEMAKDFIQNASGRHVYCFNWASQQDMNGEEFQAQINLCRQSGGLGNVAFSEVSGLEKRGLFPFYKSTVYQKSVPVPEMAWKTHPQTGIIIGKVLRKSDGQPLMDAWVKLNNQSETWLSSADGFFAILNLAPKDDYQLHVTKKDVGEASFGPVKVLAGQAAIVEVRLP